MHIEEPPQPCPFCGNNDIQYSEGHLSPSGREIWYWYLCSYCGAEAGPALSKEEAVKNWNMRADSHIYNINYGENCPFCGKANTKLRYCGSQFWYECSECGAKAGTGYDEKEAKENWTIRWYARYDYYDSYYSSKSSISNVKPCPFCGNKYLELDEIVVCPECGASSGEAETLIEAIKRWNARSDASDVGSESCPFCGGNDIITMHDEGIPDLDECFWCECEHCRCSGSTGSTKGEAIQKWRSRVHKMIR